MGLDIYKEFYQDIIWVFRVFDISLCFPLYLYINWMKKFLQNCSNCFLTHTFHHPIVHHIYFRCNFTLNNTIERHPSILIYPNIHSPKMPCSAPFLPSETVHTPDTNAIRYLMQQGMTKEQAFYMHTYISFTQLPSYRTTWTTPSQFASRPIFTWLPAFWK